MSKRTTLALIAALFALPLLLSLLLYVSGWRPGGAMNHGELVEPPRVIAGGALRTLDGTALPTGVLRGKWTLVYFTVPPCAQVCWDNLYKMRQVRLAQGDDAARVQRLLVLPGAAPPALRARLREHPGMHVVTGPPASVRELARQFTLPAGAPFEGLERVYVVDPAGRLMMSYPPDADANGMRKDLARLLRVSQIG